MESHFIFWFIESTKALNFRRRQWCDGSFIIVSRSPISMQPKSEYYYVNTVELPYKSCALTICCWSAVSSSHISQWWPSSVGETGLLGKFLSGVEWGFNNWPYYYQISKKWSKCWRWSFALWSSTLGVCVTYVPINRWPLKWLTYKLQTRKVTIRETKHRDGV